MAILQDVSKTNGKAPATADLLAQLEALKAENAQLKQAQVRSVSMKVSEKGAVSIYGLAGRFPMTHYAQTFEKLFAMSDQVLAFIEANKDKLSRK
jgi:hypothetical protein